MRRAAAIALVLAACGGGGGSPPSPPDAALPAPDVDGFDVVVMDGYIQVYAGFLVDWASPDDPDAYFPLPGDCLEVGDIMVHGPSCLTDISIDDVPLAGALGERSHNPYSIDTAIVTDDVFRATDCGHAIEVPLHPHAAPALSDVQIALGGDDILVSWSTPDAASAVVWLEEAVKAQVCHVAGTSQHTFAGLGAELSGTNTIVQAFYAPAVTDTALGPVRVWYGRGGSAFPP